MLSSQIFPQSLILPGKTLFQPGAAANLAGECLKFGSRGLIVHGQSLEKNNHKERIAAGFPEAEKVEWFCRGQLEPALEELSEVIRKARKIKACWVAGVGGGSVMDLAKAAAGLVNAPQEPEYYLGGGVLKEPGIPFIAVPTTAGTGAEATPNAVIINRGKKSKVSIRDNSFLARTVILDCELLEGLSVEVMAYAGMDAYVQAYEAFISKNATWYSETLALKAVDLIDGNILAACSLPQEENLSAMLLGSYFAGLALASARLGVIHGIAHPLGALYQKPHGLICAVCFVPAIKINRQAVGTKYDILSELVGRDFQQRITQITAGLKISSPFSGKKIPEKEKIIKDTLSSGSTAANPREVTAEDVKFILKEIFF